jgi:signal transduction histidine kinase
MDSVAGHASGLAGSVEQVILSNSVKDPLFDAFQQGSPVLVEDFGDGRGVHLAADHDDFIKRNSFRSGLFIPIRGRNGVIAILALYRHALRGYVPSDLAFADELGDRAAVSVANIELFQQSEKANRTKDEFLAVVSHELRTPLVAIVGWTNVLLSREVAPDILRKALEAIQRNANLQTKVINDILDLSGIIAGRFSITPEQIDLKTIIENTAESLKPMADTKSIDFHAETGQRPAFVIGDQNRLQQIWNNLVSNAIKFTPEHGSVRIALRFAGERIEVRVTDTGIGIAPEFLPQVFEPFAQADSGTNRRYPGLGLGLAIARQLTHLHAGDIRVDSPGPGQGTTFTVTLPAAGVRTLAC